MNRFRENIERMEGYVPGFQPEDQTVVKLNTNENPYPPAPGVLEAVRNIGAEALRRYPPVLGDAFREAAARLHGVESEMIICGNGGDELLAILARCCCDVERPLAYPWPTYSLYPVLAQIEGAPAAAVPWDNGYRLPGKLASVGAGLTIVCNPNAPTGHLIEPEEIGGLAARVGGVVAVDEAYVDFARDNCLRLLGRHENVVILRTLSKGYSLAGLRFGYALGSKRIIDTMIKVKDSYNVDAVAQAAATAAIEDQGHFRANVQKIVAERGRLSGALGQIGFDVPESETNFLLARIERPGARQVYEQLVERKIYVRYFDQEQLRDNLRITVGTAQQNDRLLGALKDIVRQEA